MSFPVLFVLFFLILPGLLGLHLFRLPMGLPGPIRWMGGGILLAAGLFIYLWTIALFARAKGTQFPVAPTQRLVANGPYRVTRNPMATGSGFMMFGVAILLDSAGFALPGCFISACYLTYIKLVEEKELAARFGEEYRKYKESTPFIIPRLTGNLDKLSQ